jgi:flagellar hook-associated protein 3 FlgL
MSINSVGFGGTLFGQAVQNLNTQLTSLSTQLATGEKSTTYSGMGTGEGFAIAARSQLSQISAFTDTITNVNTTIDAANTALTSLTQITGQVQSDAASTPQALNSTGQTIAQQNAQTELSSIVGILNTQVGNNFIFSGSANSTPSVASVDTIMNGSGTQAGLKQVISERAQADGTTGLGRLVITAPSAAAPTTVSVAEDVAGSPFGLKLNSVSSSLTGATVTGPSGSPASVSVSLGATNPNPGDQVSLTFNLPDGTTASVSLTASSATPPPTGSFTIGATPAATAANLNTALNTAIGTLANTTLVAASAVAAGNDFFDPSGTATGSVATVAPVPVTGATLLSGAPATNSVSPSFAAGNTLTVNGQTITFSASGGAATSFSATGANINLGTGTVQDILTAIDTITGTSTPSTVSGGVVTLNDNAGTVSVSSSPAGALAALGFSSPVTAVTTASGTAVTTAPEVISSATALSGTSGSDSLAGGGFTAGDTLTVNGQTIQFYTPPATAGSAANTSYLNTATANVGDLLSTIDSITGTSTPSTVSGGVITLNTDSAANLNVTASGPGAAAAMAALGFSSSPITAVQPPLRVSGSPLSSATSLVNGSADTVAWYTGNAGPLSSARASETAQVDSGISVQYGAQANEQAIRQQLQGVAVFAAVTVSPTATNSAAAIAALSSRTATNLTAQPGQQSISDIQTDYAAAQTIMQEATARQTQSSTQLQNIVDQTETVSTQEVASQILALQNTLSASYETTSMLAQLTLTKFLPAGG